jgi:drug/metabolite transporter (DMT)-like permease
MEFIEQKEKTHITKAVILAIFGSLCLSLMALSAKLAAPHSTEPVITFFRFTITTLYIFAMLFIKELQGNHITLKTRHLGMHVVRAVASTGSMYSLYYALNHIPLVDANLLSLTYPLFILILMAIFFRKRLSVLSLLAVAIGFIGIVFVLKPTPALFNSASAIGLFSGFCAAISILGIRELSAYEHPYTIMFYYSLFALVISCILVVFYWQTPDCKTLLELIGVGVFGMLYQEFLTRSLVYAPAHIPTSLMYLSVIYSSIFGMWIWGYVPDLFSWLGIVLICLGNVMVIVLK